MATPNDELSAIIEGAGRITRFVDKWRSLPVEEGHAPGALYPGARPAGASDREQIAQARRALQDLGLLLSRTFLTDTPGSVSVSGLSETTTPRRPCTSRALLGTPKTPTVYPLVTSPVKSATPVQRILANTKSHIDRLLPRGPSRSRLANATKIAASSPRPVSAQFRAIPKRSIAPAHRSTNDDVRHSPLRLENTTTRGTVPSSQETQNTSLPGASTQGSIPSLALREVATLGCGAKVGDQQRVASCNKAAPGVTTKAAPTQRAVLSLDANPSRNVSTSIIKAANPGAKFAGSVLTSTAAKKPAETASGTARGARKTVANSSICAPVSRPKTQPRVHKANTSKSAKALPESSRRPMISESRGDVTSLVRAKPNQSALFVTPAQLSKKPINRSSTPGIPAPGTTTQLSRTASQARPRHPLNAHNKTLTRPVPTVLQSRHPNAANPRNPTTRSLEATKLAPCKPPARQVPAALVRRVQPQEQGTPISKVRNHENEALLTRVIKNNASVYLVNHSANVSAHQDRQGNLANAESAPILKDMDELSEIFSDSNESASTVGFYDISNSLYEAGWLKSLTLEFQSEFRADALFSQVEHVDISEIFGAGSGSTQGS